MARRASAVLVAVTALWAVSLTIATAQQEPGADRKIWDGVYTAAQTARGKEIFEKSCGRCHNNALIGSERGPAIKGPAFWAKWENENLSALFTFLRDNMPQDGPGLVTDELKIDVLAYMMQVSGIPAGSEPLTLDVKALDSIKIARKTVVDGVYTSAQAERGKAAFLKEGCGGCHQIDLSGNRAPALMGEEFVSRWQNGPVQALFAKVRETMPPNGPQETAPETKIDIISYLLQANGFPAGRTELVADAAVLDNVDIVRGGVRAGIPNFALVQVVGCLASAPRNGWSLSRASEPVATREEESTPASLTAAQSKPLGTQDVHLVSAAGFKPASNAGKKVEARGLLYRDGGETRINLTSLQPLSQSCSN
jgi:mono/diheme cytochrome c family protein